MQLYLILGIACLLAIGGAGIGGYRHGHKSATNAAKAAHADALSDAIANARESAKIDTRLAVEAAEKRQKVRTEVKERIVTVEKAIHANPSPAECRISEPAVGLFNDIIKRANDPKTDAKPPIMPPAAPAPQRPT